MHTTEDWSKIDGIKPHPEFRLYTCRCFYHSLCGIALTFNPESFDEAGRPSRHLPWSCAGHPPLELPVQLGDRSIPDAAELAIAVVDAAQDPKHADWVLGVYFRTEHGSLETIVPDALAQAAVGPAPLAPALKTLFEAQTRLAPLNSFFEDLIRYQVGIIARPDANRREQLVDILASSIWQRPSGMPEVGTLQILRDEALEGFTTSAQLRMFGLLDLEWLEAHVDELLAKSPDRAGAILVRAGGAMMFGPDPTAAMRRLTALARKTGVPTDQLLAQAEAELGVMVVDNAEVLAAIRG